MYKNKSIVVLIYARSPRMRLANWISFGIIVTRYIFVLGPLNNQQH